MTGTLAAQDWAFWAQLRTWAGQTGSLAVRASDHLGRVTSLKCGPAVTYPWAAPVKFVTFPFVVIRPIELLAELAQGPIRPGRDPHGPVDASAGEVGDLSAGGDAPDRVVAIVGEPKGAVRPSGYRVRFVDTGAGE